MDNQNDKLVPSQSKILEIEAVAESLGEMDISNTGNGSTKQRSTRGGRRKKWTRKNTARKVDPKMVHKIEFEMGKRQCFDVMIIDMTLEGNESGEKKLKVIESHTEQQEIEPEVVLETQHRLQ